MTARGDKNRMKKQNNRKKNRCFQAEVCINAKDILLEAF